MATDAVVWRAVLRGSASGSRSDERALLNDINLHLVNFYAQLHRGPSITFPIENAGPLFYQHRARFNTLVAQGRGSPSEAAALFYYLNRTGYNGLCRFNSKGEFNVPFGRSVGDPVNQYCPCFIKTILAAIERWGIPRWNAPCMVWLWTRIRRYSAER